MKIIKDPVHGYVEVSEEFRALLDSGPVQRLRHIRQLGFSHLVYPGANHTRFEHSLGTMHLAHIACLQLPLDEEERRLVEAAALLHDIGHGPYSHATESLMEEYLGRSHHTIDHLVMEGLLAEYLDAWEIDPAEVCAMVAGTHRLSGIIHGDLDVDRMDYLLRDAHYTGVPYGTVDAHRLIRSTLMTEQGFALSEGGINAAESLLIARTLMRPAVYFHHVSRIAETMAKCAAAHHFDTVGAERAGPLLAMDDAAFSQELLGSGSATARDMMARIHQRRLYKRALYVGREQVNVASLQPLADIHGEWAMAEEIAATAGIEPEDVLVDIPSFPSHMTMEVQVRNQHDLVNLEQISPLLTSLNETRREQWRVGVYTLPQYRKEVERAAIDILHVRKATKQDKLILY
jgi:HD superfamily phosphohydrolase